MCVGVCLGFVCVSVKEKVLPAERSATSAVLLHSVSLSLLRALPPNASIPDPLQRPLIAVETALKEKIRIASSPI